MYDRLIIGAGIYGMYAAIRCASRGEKVLVLEMDDAPFSRATYVNQARVHMGYHYPRSLYTATRSASYYRRFHEDFSFAFRNDFKQIYATGADFSWTDREQFIAFCDAAGIPCEEVPISKYFRKGACDGAFLTTEGTFDAIKIRDHFTDTASRFNNLEIRFGCCAESIEPGAECYTVRYTDKGKECFADAPFVLNATYASVNQLISGAGMDDLFSIRYELCEIILVKPSDALKDVGITVMDGPFFSVMPFGHTPYHSLTSVSFTPHTAREGTLPLFECMDGTGCGEKKLLNCDTCEKRPKSSWDYMKHLADRYLLPEYDMEFVKGLFSMKPVLTSAGVDDARPTAIRVHHKKPYLVSVLSGKINTVYDLDEVLDEA